MQQTNPTFEKWNPSLDRVSAGLPTFTTRQWGIGALAVSSLVAVAVGKRKWAGALGLCISGLLLFDMYRKSASPDPERHLSPHLH